MPRGACYIEHLASNDSAVLQLLHSSRRDVYLDSGGSATFELNERERDWPCIQRVCMHALHACRLCAAETCAASTTAEERCWSVAGNYGLYVYEDANSRRVIVWPTNALLPGETFWGNEISARAVLCGLRIERKGLFGLRWDFADSRIPV